jgi:hypothetical protein
VGFTPREGSTPSSGTNVFSLKAFPTSQKPVALRRSAVAFRLFGAEYERALSDALSPSGPSRRLSPPLIEPDVSAKSIGGAQLLDLIGRALDKEIVLASERRPKSRNHHPRRLAANV